MGELRDVKKLAIAKNVDEANQKLEEGWVLLDMMIALRHVHHVPVDEKDEGYDFDLPFHTFVVGLMK